MNKYHARKVTIDGIKFDSQAEGRRYLYLKSEQEAGRIHGLQCHPKFELLPAMDWNGKHYRPVRFTPDFRYIENGKNIAEDVKGGRATITRDFKLRLRLWILNHPNEDKWDFRIVEA